MHMWIEELLITMVHIQPQYIHACLAICKDRSVGTPLPMWVKRITQVRITQVGNTILSTVCKFQLIEDMPIAILNLPQQMHPFENPHFKSCASKQDNYTSLAQILQAP